MYMCNINLIHGGTAAHTQFSVTADRTFATSTKVVDWLDPVLFHYMGGLSIINVKATRAGRDDWSFTGTIVAEGNYTAPCAGTVCMAKIGPAVNA